MRIVRSDDGSLAVGRTLPGRGAWLCDASDSCLDLALRRKAFGRAFRAPISDGAPDSLRVLLREHARIGSRDM
ncbi:MAG: YlxR family protein [Actinomycetota bacterium]|nr:YlxR family protein [Actinomycetota bacterium]